MKHAPFCGFANDQSKINHAFEISANGLFAGRLACAATDEMTPLDFELYPPGPSRHNNELQPTRAVDCGRTEKQNA